MSEAYLARLDAIRERLAEVRGEQRSMVWLPLMERSTVDRVFTGRQTIEIDPPYVVPATGLYRLVRRDGALTLEPAPSADPPVLERAWDDLRQQLAVAVHACAEAQRERDQAREVIAALMREITDRGAEVQRLRAQMAGPIATRHADGRVTVEWPSDDARQCLIAREVLGEMLAERDQLRAELAAVRTEADDYRAGRTATIAAIEDGIAALDIEGLAAYDAERIARVVGGVFRIGEVERLRGLLARYARHVEVCEGTDFLARPAARVRQQHADGRGPDRAADDPARGGADVSLTLNRFRELMQEIPAEQWTINDLEEMETAIPRLQAMAARMRPLMDGPPTLDDVRAFLRRAVACGTLSSAQITEVLT